MQSRDLDEGQAGFAPEEGGKRNHRGWFRKPRRERAPDSRLTRMGWLCRKQKAGR